MGGENTIVLRVTLDEGATEKQLADLVLKMEATRQAQLALTAARKQGSVSDAEFAQRTVQLSGQLAMQRTEFGSLQKTLNAYQLATGNAAGSIESLKGQSALLTAQYNKLSEAERTNTEAGKAIGEELKKVNDALLAGGKNVGDFRRNVGNYEDALKGANLTTKDFKGGLSAAVDTGLKPFQSQLDRGTGLLGKFGSGNELVTKGLRALQPAGETGALGFKAVGAAVLLTGLGIFLLLLQSVVLYFTNTAEGGKLLKQALAGVGAVVNTLTGAVYGLGKGLVEAAKNPKQAFEDLLGFLKAQVINRFTAFGVILEGISKRDFKQVANGIIQLNTGFTNGIDRVTAYAKGIAESAGNAVDLTAKLQVLAKQRKENEVDEVKEKGRVEELIRLSKDRTLSADNRLNKLREAGRIENELSAKSLNITKQELDLIQQRNKAKGLNITSDEIQEERDKRREYNQTVTDRNNSLATIKARQSRFILEEAAELKAATKTAADAAKQRAKDAVAAKQTENELALVAVEKGSAAELALKQQAVDLASDFELAGEKKTQEQIKLVRAKAEGDKLDLLTSYQQKEIELAKKADAARLAEVKREYAEAERNLEDYLAAKKSEVENDLAAGRIGQNIAQQRLNAIERAGYAAALVNASDYAQDKAKIVKAQADLEIKEAQRVKDEKKKIEDTKQQIQDAAFQAASNTTNLIIDLFGKESTAGRIALATKRTLALAEIGINTEKILVLNAKTGASIAAEIPPPVGPILGTAYVIAQDALAISAAAASAAKILGFRQGGVLVGPSHEKGGIPFTVAGRPGFEAEGDEIIMARGVWNNPLLRPIASWLNVAGGGAPLVPRTHMALGGVAQPLVQQQLAGNVQPPIDYNRLAQAMSKLNIYTKTQETMQSIDKVLYTKNDLGSN